MKRFFTLLLLGVSLLGQAPPGSITVTTTVVAAAPAGQASGTQVSCTFSNANRPSIHTTCALGGTIYLVEDATPAVGSTNGTVGSFTVGTNAVTWILQQPTAGNVTWQIAANGTSQSGTF